MFGGTSSLSGGTALERTLDKLTVVSGVIFGLCTFWLSGSGTRRSPPPRW
jgi:preprotein translocase subunit SecG